MKRINPWVPGVAALALAGTVAVAQMPRDPAPPMPPMHAFGVYEGESASGHIQEALDDAVAKAVRAEAKSGAIHYQVTQIFGDLGSGGAGPLRVQVQVGRRERKPMESAIR